jgi:hypothetical protein
MATEGSRCGISVFVSVPHRIRGNSFQGRCDFLPFRLGPVWKGFEGNHVRDTSMVYGSSGEFDRKGDQWMGAIDQNGDQ